MQAWNSSPIEIYTCKITSASITSDCRTINSFIGAHSVGKSDRDVKAVWFYNTNVHFFPRGLHKYFPDLTFICISNCGLKEITRDDLKGLENLEYLSLTSNPLTSLPSNSFENMPKLRRIVLNDNQLEFVSTRLLQPIIHNGLTRVDFRRNKNIDAFYEPGIPGSVKTIKELMDIIDKQCIAPKLEEEDDFEHDDAHKSKIYEGLEKLWENGRFSDFKIIVGSKTFYVHKLIFSIHSSVSAKQTENANEMKIEDISAEAVHDFLRYLYTGKLPDANNAMDAFALAAKLEVDKLKTICGKIICKKVLNNSNAYKVFMLGHVYGADELKLAAFNRIKAMFPEADFPDSLMQQPESLKKLMEHKRDIDNLLQSFSKFPQ